MGHCCQPLLSRATGTYSKARLSAVQCYVSRRTPCRATWKTWIRSVWTLRRVVAAAQVLLGFSLQVKEEMHEQKPDAHRKASEVNSSVQGHASSRTPHKATWKACEFCCFSPRAREETHRREPDEHRKASEAPSSTWTSRRTSTTTQTAWTSRARKFAQPVPAPSLMNRCQMDVTARDGTQVPMKKTARDGTPGLVKKTARGGTPGPMEEGAVPTAGKVVVRLFKQREILAITRDGREK